MKQPFVMKGPTLTNPNALKTVPALREALSQANSTILDLSVQLSEERQALGNCSRALAHLVFLYIAHDDAGLQAQLDNLVAQMKRPADQQADQAPAQPGGMH